ncbi:MAG: hypothetical protein M1826_002282 [Phylliscum demangeonii]|nr:MAG: hypothetical protein M1826_002282 [Phylliscum demangeonii]
MEAVLQVDLARSEAPAQQALKAVRGEAAGRSSKGPFQGGSATTVQVSLRSDPSDLYELDWKEDSFGESANVVTLQPVDGGFGAWSYVASAFAMFIVVWGFPQAFPIFQNHLSSGKSAMLPQSVVLPLLAPGLQDIEEGILFQMLPKAAKFRRLLVIGGISIIALAMLLASYSNAAWQIVLTQGVLFGIGGIMLNFVHVSVFSEWFDKRKGQAMGIIWLGWRVGSLSFPLICQWLLDNHGYAKTLRVLIAPMLALLLPCVILFRGRYSVGSVTSTSSIRPPVSKLTALRAPNVLYYLFATLAFYFVVNVPRIFLASYGADLHLTGSDQALAVSLNVLCEMLGTFGLGWLSNGESHQGLVVACAMSSSVAYLTWGFAKTKAALFLCSMAIGLTSGGYTNAMFSFFSEVAGHNSELFTAVHSLFSFFRGMAILSVGPVGVTILRRSPAVTMDAYAIGKYQYLLAYAAAMSMTSGFLVLLRMGLRPFGSSLHAVLSQGLNRFLDG